jgi:phage baseplate assembly protein W
MAISGLSTRSTKIQKFLNTVPENNGVLKDIDSVIDSTGDFKLLKDIDVIVKSLERLLLIAPGTYPFDPTMGVGIHRFIFEPADSNTQDQIKDLINNAVANFEQRAKIEFDITFLNNKKGFIVDFVVDYQGLRRNSKIEVSEETLNSIP